MKITTGRAPKHDRHDDRNEERAGAMFAGNVAHRLGNHHSNRGCGKEDDNEGEEAGDTADQLNQQAGKEGQDAGSEKPQDEIDRTAVSKTFNWPRTHSLQR